MAKTMSAKEAKNLTQTMQALSQTMQALGPTMEKAFKKGSAGLDDMEDKTIDVEKKLKDLSGDLEKLGKVSGKSMKEINDATKEYDNELEAIKYRIKEIQKSGSPVDPEELKSLKDRISRVTNELDVMHGNVTSNADAFRNMGSGLKMFGSLFKSLGRGPGAMAEQGAAAAGMAKTLGNMPGLFGKMVMAAKGLGSVLGGVSKMFTGLPGLIIGGIIELGKLYIAADKFVKDANKRFAAVRGPNIMTPDVDKQFKDFNNQIYNVVENLKVGFNTEQIMGFVGAVTQAGAHLDKIRLGVDDYRASIDVAARASRTLGVDIVEVGSMMGSLIMEYRMNLDNMDKTFSTVAFDAQRAGMSTNNFWNAVMGATTGMVFYGVSLEKVGKLLSEFNKSGTMSTQQTIQTVETLDKTFSNMNTTQKQISLTVLKRIPGMMDYWKKSAKEKILKIDEELDITTDKGRRAELQWQKKMLSRLAKGNVNSWEMSQALPYISEYTAGMLSMVQKYFAPNGTFTRSNLLKLEKIFEAVGVDSKLVESQGKLEENWNTVYQGIFSEILNNTNKFVGLSEEQKTTLDNNYAILKDSKKSDEDRANAQSAITNILTGILGKNDAESLAELVQLFPEVSDILSRMAKGAATREDMKILEKYAKRSDMGSKRMININKLNALSSADISDKAKETANNIMTNTTSIEDVGTIVGEGAKWAAGSFLQLRSLNTAAWSIFRSLPGAKGGATQEQLEASQQLIDGFGKKIAALGITPKMDKHTGIISNAAEIQSAAVGQLVDTMKKRKEAAEKGAGKDKLNKFDEAITSLTAFASKTIQAAGGTQNLSDILSGKVIIVTIGAPTPVPEMPATDAGGKLITSGGGEAFSFPKARYLMPENNPNPVGAGKTNTQNVTITINAIEKDLPDKIVNKIREVSYKKKRGQE